MSYTNLIKETLDILDLNIILMNFIKKNLVEKHCSTSTKVKLSIADRLRQVTSMSEMRVNRRSLSLLFIVS